MGLGCKLRGLRAELFSLRFPTSDLHDFIKLGVVLEFHCFRRVLHSFTWVLVRCIQCGWKLLVSCIVLCGVSIWDGNG